MIYYTTLTGQSYRYPTAHLALLNWFVDGVDPDGSQMVMVATGQKFVDQILAAIERVTGRYPRIDRAKSEPQQHEALLRLLLASGQLKKLKIKH